MIINQFGNDEARINYEAADGKQISISVTGEGIILDLYSHNDLEPTSLGFTVEELVEFLEEHGVK